MSPVRIGHLSDGDVAYVTPWAFFCDAEGATWIAMDVDFRFEAKGSYTVKVARTQDGLYVSSTDYDRCRAMCPGMARRNVNPIDASHRRMRVSSDASV